MANSWGIAGMTTGIAGILTVLGWFLNPIISSLLSKLFAGHRFDAPRKLRELEFTTIPELKEMLRGAEKLRMERSTKDKESESDLKALDKLAMDLKSTLYEAEDILDEIEYHRIEKKVMGDAKSPGTATTSWSWVQNLDDAVRDWINRCKGTWFGQWVHALHSTGSATVSTTPDATSNSVDSANGSRGDNEHSSSPQAPTPDAPSNSRLVQMIRHLDITSCCKSILLWPTIVNFRGWFQACRVKLRQLVGNLKQQFTPHADIEQGSTAQTQTPDVPSDPPTTDATSNSAGSTTAYRSDNSPDSPSNSVGSATESTGDNEHGSAPRASAPDSPSNHLVKIIREWSMHLDITRCCRSILLWITFVISALPSFFSRIYSALCSYRDWVNGAVCIQNDDDNTVDYVLATTDRNSLRKRIEHTENNLSDLKRSILLNQDSSSSEILAKDTNKESSSTKEEIEELYRMIERKVFGRDKEREHICSMLREGPDSSGPSSSSRRHYSVIGIHGITGSGKSTLAQYVCDHEKKAEDKHFDPIMFSHVSMTFRVDRIFRDMLEQITEDRPSDSSGFKSLQKMLREKLEGKRFLLLLEDLWVNNENQKGLDVLLDALNAGQNGSKILVTAQREDAAAALGGVQEQISIADMEEKHYLSLFMHHARPGTTYDDGDYERIGSKIAKKLHSSPIAAVTVGKQLQRNAKISFWKTTANDDVLNGTMGALWWSCQQLGSDVRRCFAYCSTFPRGYNLKRDQMVHMWIAQGFVNIRSGSTLELEDIGQHYVDELLTFSFLQVQRTIFGTETKEFTIHDLLHELAERVAGSDFHRIESNDLPKDIPPGVRHVFIESNNGAEIAENYLELGSLRTLIIKERHTCTDIVQPMDVTEINHDLEKVFERLVTRLRKLRVLVVEINLEGAVFSVPASIDQMKHLRYIGFHYAGARGLVLPRTFSKLYHMQTIQARHGFNKVSYPEDMSNLIHLRRISGHLLFPNVGRLTSLQMLETFEVKKERGYELKQLKHLNKIRGTLKIFGLGNVESKKEALEAHLTRKNRVTNLSLFFTGRTRDPDILAEVFESLCPPKDLVELTILFYNCSSRYPSWISHQHPDTPKRLQKLVLSKCSRLASIPEDSELFIHLLELGIEYCDWDSLPENMEHLMSLKNLEIVGCDNMEVFPMLPKSLRKIKIRMCNKLSQTCKQEGHGNWHKIQHIPDKFVY